MAKYSQTDYFQANSLFVGSTETGDLLGVELHTGKGSDMLCPQKSSSYTFSVSLFQLKFNSFPSSKILGPFSSGHAWLSALTLIVTTQLVTAYPGAGQIPPQAKHHKL